MLRLDGTVKEVDDAETGFFLNENVAKTFFRRSSSKNEVLIDSGIRNYAQWKDTILDFSKTNSRQFHETNYHHSDWPFL